MSYITSIVDSLDLYARCHSSVNMFIMGVNLLVITVSHILYILFRRAVGLKLLSGVSAHLYIYM